MPSSPSIRLPRLSFVLAISFSLVAIGSLAGSYRWASSLIHGFEGRELALERACARVTYLDEVLTMSAFLAAHSGDLEWERRYEAHVALLDEALAEAAALGPDEAFLGGNAQTAEANERLVALEQEAFELVRNGRLEESQALLGGEEYSRLKELYTAGNERALERIRASLAGNLEEARAAARRNAALLLAMLPVLLGLWWSVLRTLRAHGRARREAESRSQDYTERLEAQREELRRAASARAEFLARMSHEIRTPMNGVLGAAELLGDTGLTADQRELVGTVESSGRHLLGIINDVLDVAKIEAGKLTVAPEPCDPREVALGAGRLLAPEAKRRGVDLELDLPERAGPRVLLDPQRVRQILVNLIGNALKFTPEGSVTLGMKMKAAEDRGSFALILTVADTGIGIAPKDKERVFQNFEQVEGSAARRFGGSGLGLTICRELVGLMGGELSLESRLGIGSTFTVHLPVKAVEEAADAGPEVAQAQASLAGLSVLVVEDNEVNRRIAERMLRARGCDVAVAEDGAAGLERMARDAFDLVLMDCHMPGVDGFEAARRRRAIEQRDGLQRTPIIALSASTLPSEIAACRRAGMDDFVGKPVSGDLLAAAVHRWTRGLRRSA